jgi:hypothetical protein
MTDPTKEDLRQRIAELEQTVAELETEIEQQDKNDSDSLIPTGVIGSGVGLLGLGALGGSASAQAGTIGTTTDPIDLVVEDVSADRLRLTELTSDPSNLPSGTMFYRGDLD